MPTTTPGTTQPTQPLQPHIVNRVVGYENLSAGASSTDQTTRDLSLSALVTHMQAGAIDQADRADYPLIQGTVVGAAATHTFRFSARDSVASNSTLQGAFSSNGNQALSWVGRETFNHRFDKHTNASLGAGLSITRNSQPDGLVAYSVYPNFLVNAGYADKLARGDFSFVLGAFSTPVLDPLRATVDPRVGLTINAAWSRRRFSILLSGSGAVSAAPAGNDAGAFNSYLGSFVSTYRATDWLAFDAGARVTNQAYQGVTIVPWSYTIFTGITLGHDFVLSHSR
jgi:hypothetical protein